MIAWPDFLLLLEGEPTHVPAPKTHYSKDILIDSDVPIFCTSAKEILMIKNGVVMERENEMMEVRWKHFKLFSQIPPAEQRTLQPCGHCFAAFVLPDHILLNSQIE